jgi:ADP-heptose:LPS heptosyltransferase
MGWGDDLMVLGEAQAKSAKMNNKPIAIIDGQGNLVRSTLFKNQRCIAGLFRPEQYTLAMGPGGRPYIAGHSIDGRVWRKYKPKPAKLVFNPQEQEYIDTLPGGYVVIEPHVKQNGGGKANKEWGFHRYQNVVKKLPEIDWVQMGDGTAQRLKGVTYIQTPTFRVACAVLSKAKGYLGPEGGLHHAAAAVGIPAVVIFGGYISPQVTGYDSHINLFTGQGLGCGKHAKCACDCMARITEDQVVSMTRQLAGLDRQGE